MAYPHVIVDSFLTDPNYNWYYGDDAFGVVYSPDGRYALSGYSPSGPSFNVLDYSTDTYTIYGDGSGVNLISCAMDNDGTIYGTNGMQLRKVTGFGAGTESVINTHAYNIAYCRLFIMPDNSRKVVYGHYADPDPLLGHHAFEYDVTSGVITPKLNPSPDATLYYERHCFVQDSYGDVWDIAHVPNDADPTTWDLAFWRVIDGGAGTAAPDFTIISGLAPASHVDVDAVHTPSGWIVVVGKGQRFYRVNDTTMTISQTREFAALGVANMGTFENTTLSWLAPGRTVFWYIGRGSPLAAGVVNDVEKIRCSDLSTLQTLETAVDWVVGDVVDSESFEYSAYRNGFISRNNGTFETSYVVIRELPANGQVPEEETGGVTDDELNIRVWGFSLDGHDFYCLRLGASETFVYDLTTDKWSRWESPESGNWRAHVGQNWVGMGPTTFARGFGSDVVAGDDSTGTLWVLDPTQGLDDNTTTGSTAFNRVVTGGLQVTGRDIQPCGAVTLDLAVGNPALTGHFIQLEISDDLGKSWVECGSVTVVADANDAVVEWRGLGTIKAPGRVFRLTDSGATSRIGALNIR